MKKSLLIPAIALTLGLNFQTVQASELQNSTVETVAQKFDPSNWTKEQCQQYLNKVDEKKAYFNNHPEEKAQAEKEGWFEKVDQEVALVNQRLQELKK